MTRLAALIVLVAAVAGALLLTGAGEERRARVDAIFDNASNLIPGQDVRIAGARVGEVADVRLTPDRRARIEMQIESGFVPFRADARCEVRPQGLIGEKFVQCDPGTPRARLLADGPTGVPTVPLARTSAPVDLDLVFAALRRPAPERLAIVIGELGAGLAGRGDDLAAAIRRANPALARADELLAVLDRDRRTLRALVGESDAVLRRLAAREDTVRRLIERAGEGAGALAERRADLDRTVARMPALLAQLEPGADELAAWARDARPVARDLTAAAPGLRALLDDADPLVAAATPALEALGDTARRGTRAVTATRPLARSLVPVGERAPRALGNTTDLLESMRDSGVLEGIQRYVFYTTLVTSRFDAVSHILPSYQVFGDCQDYATEPVPGCDAHFAAARSGGEGDRGDAAAPARRTRRPARRGGERTAPRGEPPARRPARPRGQRPPVPALPDPARRPVETLLDYLLAP